MRMHEIGSSGLAKKTMQTGRKALPALHLTRGSRIYKEFKQINKKPSNHQWADEPKFVLVCSSVAAMGS